MVPPAALLLTEGLGLAGRRAPEESRDDAATLATDETSLPTVLEDDDLAAIDLAAVVPPPLGPGAVFLALCACFFAAATLRDMLLPVEPFPAPPFLPGASLLGIDLDCAEGRFPLADALPVATGLLKDFTIELALGAAVFRETAPAEPLPPAAFTATAARVGLALDADVPALRAAALPPGTRCTPGLLATALGLAATAPRTPLACETGDAFVPRAGAALGGLPALPLPGPLAFDTWFPTALRGALSLSAYPLPAGLPDLPA